MDVLRLVSCWYSKRLLMMCKPRFVFERRALRLFDRLSLFNEFEVLLFPSKFGEHAGALDGRRTDGYVGFLPFG